ncbi:hypothetical protein jhhlp_007880 [Lomentospora prolificans]|uniref:N-acetyltransferase domain-containing protein n=1 Tax=Lomentospora prolificans TaxID=41688 RepID=A0A2N3N0T6_9PEZI|nr:hypothetical protein jhhlp_007880 [Lomentospora prolificans]
MAPTVLSSPQVPEGLLDLLNAHLPYSLPLLRRLQFTRFKGGSSPASRILYTPPPDTGLPQNAHFAAAYVDLAAGLETQMWIYSTLEDSKDVTAEDWEICAEQIVAVAEEAKKLGRAFEGELAYPGAILIGTLHAAVVKALDTKGARIKSNSENLGYHKWLFRAEELPTAELHLEDGMHWAPTTPEDCGIAISRTYLPRQLHTFILLPGLTIKLRDGTPVAWAFLGVDGSLSSLHCEEGYRGKGFAKALAAKLFREGTEEYGHDGWCHADVSPDNLSSAAVCKSLNGKVWWHGDWVQLLL